MHCRINRKNILLITVLLLTIGAIMALPAFCADETTQTAVIATVAADYSSGAVSIVNIDPVGGPRSYQNKLNPTISDIIVAAYENYYYLIVRTGDPEYDNITKYDISAPDTPIYQYSVADKETTTYANVSDMIFVSSEKAYLLRYGKNVAWIVNPSAATEAAFKIGELDLSGYDDGDGASEMAAGVIVDGKLYIAMQRLTSWAPSNTAYLAVFDTDTDTEIDTGVTNSDGVKGIPLTIRNPTGITYCSDNDTIYVQGPGDYSSSTYTGGVETINPTTYATNVLVDENETGIKVGGMVILSADKGYLIDYSYSFVTYTSVCSLYEFSPTDGTVADDPVDESLSDIGIAGMQAGTYLDQNDMLWVCDQTNAQVVILDTSDNSVDETVATSLNPSSIAFTTEGEAGEGSGGGGSSGCFIQTMLGF